jgi:cytochrome c556
MSSLRVLSLALLSLAILALSVDVTRAEPDKDELKVAKAVIDKLVAGAEVKDVADQKKKTSPEAIMALLNTTKKGGLGYAPKGPTGSIEARITEIAKKGITDADLKKESADLAKAAAFVQAVNDFNELYTPKIKVGDKDPKVWEKSNAEARKVTADLIEAIKGNDAKKVTAAAKALDAACYACHKVFKK